MRSKKKKKRCNLTIFGKVIVIFFFLLTTFFVFNSIPKQEIKENKSIKKVLKKEAKKEMKASLLMVGDALIHSTLYQDAKTNDGYDFKPMLERIKPIASKYDLEYYNQETILGGEELGLSNYPRFNSPYEVGDAFIDAGFNLVSLATNHTMDKGEQGVLNSLAYWNKKKNVLTGKKAEKEDKKKVEGQFDMYNYKLAEIAHELDKVNLNELTPIDALNTLVKIKEKMK